MGDIMKIILDKNAGFCFGVKNAVAQTLKTIENNKEKRVFTYGPLIHNKQVTEDLRNKGVIEIESLLDDIDKDSLIIIRFSWSAQNGSRRNELKRIKYCKLHMPICFKNS